ncbi:Ig-like domain-containing domain [Segatella copri]|uniref:Ig-like domain-containing domain n=1 Tax=Segatella copri TaxID=165179 RepID=UPI0035A0B8A3
MTNKNDIIQLLKNRIKANTLFLPFYLLVFLLLVSCAKMGQPDGGWFDETPPKVIGASPADGAVNVNQKKINIYFDEFIKLDNPSEKVVVSPPQLEQPEIKGAGRRIQISLVDSLKANTTYTIDFSDAISDNNEGNPMGNYTYSFSTGAAIDTMEVSGHVLESENLEPVKGILVGLYADHADSAFRTKPMLRVSRTDSRGRFVIKGVAPGSYRIYALQDQDGDYKFSQKSEKIAFSHDIIVPSCKPDVRQDTTWVDSLHIKSIDQVDYIHFLPDNIVLRAFTEPLTDRFFLKAERQKANSFTLFFSYGDSILPQIKGLNFDAENAFLVEASEKKDTITYWLKDTALVNQDTLLMDITYRMTDSTGVLVNKTDSAQEILSKEPYAKRMKNMEKELAAWTKKQEKKKKKGEPYDSVMEVKPLDVQLSVSSQFDPDQNVIFSFPTPLAKVDTAAIHLYAKHDTLWYRAPMEFLPLENRKYELRGEWRPDIEYSLEVDSAAFEDIYGLASKPIKQGFKVNSLDTYGTLLVNITSLHDLPLIVQLLDAQDKVVKETKTVNGVAEFYYLKPQKYYMRLIVDRNNNGKWDTGNYASDQQAEEVYYYPEAIECKAKWDLTESWDPLARELSLQKPGAITKQKPDKEKKVKNQNVQRAAKLGIQYVPKM